MYVYIFIYIYVYICIFIYTYMYTKQIYVIRAHVCNRLMLLFTLLQKFYIRILNLFRVHC